MCNLCAGTQRVSGLGTVIVMQAAPLRVFVLGDIACQPLSLHVHAGLPFKAMLQEVLND